MQKRGEWIVAQYFYDFFNRFCSALVQSFVPYTELRTFNICNFLDRVDYRHGSRMAICAICLVEDNP